MRDALVAGRNLAEDKDLRTRDLLESLVRLPQSRDEDQASLDVQVRSNRKDSRLWNDVRLVEENSAPRNYRDELKHNDEVESNRGKTSAALRLMRLLRTR